MLRIKLILILLVCTTWFRCLTPVEKIDSIIEEYHRAGHFNGVALIVNNNLIAYEKTFGMADFEQKKKLSLKNNFYIASISKQFTTVAIAYLVSKRKLKYKQKIRRFFPRLRRITKGVTIHHLLVHQSGIPDYYPMLPKKAKKVSNRYVIKLLRRLKQPKFKPGEEYEYSNSNYILLAEIIKKVTRQRFSTFMRRKIFKRAKLKSTKAKDSQKIKIKRLAKRYRKDGEEYPYQYTTVGGGGIFSNVYDLFRWYRALRENKIIPKKYRDTLWSEHVISKREHPYGYGFYVFDHKNEIYHDGSLMGYHSMNWMNHKTGDMVILLANCETKKILELGFELIPFLRDEDQ